MYDILKSNRHSAIAPDGFCEILIAKGCKIMSKLIEKRLAALEPGAQVELKFNDGDTEQKLAGVVTDTDHEEGMMVRTEQGEEVYLAFREVLVFKQLGTAPAVSVTPPTPAPAPTAPMQTPAPTVYTPPASPVAGTISFRPSYSRKLDFPQMRDDELKQAFDSMPKKAKMLLSGQYNSLLYGLKNSDYSKSKQAAAHIEELLRENPECARDPQVAKCCVGLMRRAGHEPSFVFSMGGDYPDAARFYSTQKVYDWAGAYAALAIQQGAQDETLAEMFTILDKACRETGDVEILSWLFANTPGLYRMYADDLLYRLAILTGLPLARGGDWENCLLALRSRYPNRILMDHVLYLQKTIEEVSTEEEEMEPSQEAKPVLTPEEESLLCGSIIRISWVGERGTIQYADNTVSFQYAGISDFPLRTKIQQQLQADLGGEPISVCFRLKNNRAVDVQTGPLERARTARAEDNINFDRVWAWLERALTTCAAPDALAFSLDTALAEHNATASDAPLTHVLELYQEHKSSLPATWQNYVNLAQIYRLTGDLETTLTLDETAEALCPDFRSYLNVLQRELHIMKKQYDATGELSWLERLAKKSRQYLQYCQEHPDMHSHPYMTFARGNGIVNILEYACAMDNTATVEEFLPQLHQDNVQPEVYTYIMNRITEFQEKHRPQEEFLTEEVLPEEEIPVEEEAIDENEPASASLETEKASVQPEKELENSEDPEPSPYVDTDGWEKLGLTKEDVVLYALSIQGEARLPRMLAYLKAGAELNPEIFPVYRIVSLAADNPAFDCDISIGYLMELLANCDADYPILNSYCMAAACLQALFSNSSAFDFTVGPLRDSIDAFNEIDSLREVYDTLCTFNKWNDRSLDSLADYQKLDTLSQTEKLQQTLNRASDLYQQFILTPPREEASFARNVETKRIAFARNSMLAILLKEIIDGDAESLTAFKEEFQAQWLIAGRPFAASSISSNSIDRYIDDCWAKASEALDVKHHNTRLQGNRRNNLHSSLKNILSVICDWYSLQEQGITLQQENSPAEAAYQNLRPRITEQLQALEADCTILEQDSDPEKSCGAYLLGVAVQGLLRRIDGSWNEELHRCLYADFLRSNWVLLDENYLPDTSFTFCALDDYNILARIRHHCEEELPTLEEHLQEIFTNDPVQNNYGTSQLIWQYLEILEQEIPSSVPDDPEPYIEQTARRAQRDLSRFREDYILSLSRGQIIQSDSFLMSMDETVRRLYLDCSENRNYGFWFRLVEQCYTQIHQVAAQYGTQLQEQLQSLVANNQSYFSSSPNVEKEIRDLIEAQNYTVAEDWMNRVRRGDFDVQFESSEAIGFLQQFWAEFDNNFRMVRDAGTSLRSLLTHSGARKDRKGGQLLVDNWLSNGRSTSPERIARFLTLLGWDNIQVQPVNLTTGNTEIYRVTEPHRPVGIRNPLHPIADFGSKVATAGFCTVCLYGTYDCDRLLAKFKALDGIQGAKLVLVDYALSAPERRKLARKIKKKETGLSSTYLVLDRVLLVYLANHYNDGAINRMLMAIGMPFSYYQPYVADSSNPMPPEMFIGRKDELLKIEQPNGVNLIYGGRQLGKSALFKKVRIDIDGNQGRRAVLVDLAGYDCAKAAYKLSCELIDLKILPEGSETESWSDLARSIKARLRSEENPIPYLLIMLDEADIFVEDCKAYNYQPLADLKDIQQTLPEQFKFVLAGLHNIVRFNREVALGRNAVITHLPSLNVKPFEMPEAHELLVQPLSYLGFSLEDRVLISQILATTNYFPGLIQMYGQKLIESMRQNNYAGYNEASTPPYVITEDHIRRVLADNNFLAEIQNKFEITLRLDQDQGSYYYTVALLIGWMYTACPTTIGYTADDLMAQANDLGLEALTHLNREQIDALLQELYDLNILRSTGKDTYLFASKNFHDLLGNENEIFEKLGQIGGREA